MFTVQWSLASSKIEKEQLRQIVYDSIQLCFTWRALFTSFLAIFIHPVHIFSMTKHLYSSTNTLFIFTNLQWRLNIPWHSSRIIKIMIISTVVIIPRCNTIVYLMSRISSRTVLLSRIIDLFSNLAPRITDIWILSPLKNYVKNC